MISLLLAHCLLLLPLCAPIVCSWSWFCDVVLCVTEEERAGCLNLIVVLLSSLCVAEEDRVGCLNLIVALLSSGCNIYTLSLPHPINTNTWLFFLSLRVCGGYVVLFQKFYFAHCMLRFALSHVVNCVF